jgi:hopanoid-associated phosphorylase
MIGVIVGMRTEAKLWPKGTRVEISGGRADKAYALACRMLEDGADGLLSFGIAGGLDPDLRPGALVVASAVAVGDELIPCDPLWREGLLRRLTAMGKPLEVAEAGPRELVVGVEKIVASLSEKSALHGRWRARAVDLESAGVARASAQFDKPFAVLRAVADPAWRAIPDAALDGLDEKGSGRPLAVVADLAVKPWLFPAVIRVALDARAGLAALARAIALLDASLGFEPAGLVSDQ